MKRLIVRFPAFLLAYFLAVSPASAATLLSDTFATENGGVGVLNYSTFTNWTVSGGTVDLIGNGFSDLLPGNNLYVDLDGSTTDAGLFATKTIFAAGTYIVEFDLAGSQRGSTETVTVTFDTYSEVFTKFSGDPFAKVTRTITTTGPSALAFQNTGGDNLGALLDNVRVATPEVVPEPSSVILFGVGIAAMARRIWRRKQRVCE